MEKELPVAKPENEPDMQIVKFLLGEDTLDGVWFGDIPEGKPKFWWRKNLRELKDELESLPAQQSWPSEEEAKKVFYEMISKHTGQPKHIGGLPHVFYGDLFHDFFNWLKSRQQKGNGNE